MPHSSQLKKLYAEVTICHRNCVGIENEPAHGIIGRSFYCPFDVSRVSLLLVSKNPAISDPRENELYAPLRGRERVAAHENFVRSRFEGTNFIITSKYHANIISRVSAILDVPAEHDAVFSQTAMTALVKCHSINSKSTSLPNVTKNTCAGLYLYREIEIIKPKFLLALGTEPYNYLTRPDVRRRHRLPVGKLYHPSWSNMPGGVERYMAEDIPEIREQYLEAIST